jgi:hypothetical protein
MMTREERDQVICRAYLNDQVTSTELARRYKLSRTRINQILNSHGFDRMAKERTDVRDCYIGIMLSKGTKEEAKKVAKSEGKSMSQYIADLVADDLKSRGIEPAPHISNEIELPLPLEGDEA